MSIEKCFCQSYTKDQLANSPDAATYEIMFWPDSDNPDDRRIVACLLCGKRCAMVWTARFLHVSFNIKKHVSGPDYLMGNLITREEFNRFLDDVFKHS